ncbi:serine/threonine-protein kinase pim-3-like isoform X2 [Paramormyrops kingsleyae]|uniref:serine/threonine-protein kinase pim-3-like isoform X2 n=1 Tax=Paramormyrops kingsleyae TaxID=1676925 RepID=UPI003B970B76
MEMNKSKGSPNFTQLVNVTQTKSNMEIKKPSVLESRVRGMKRSRSPSKDEGRPVKRGRRTLNSQSRIRPTASTTKTQKGPFKVSESRVRGKKRSRSPDEDEERPGKRGRSKSPAAVPSGHNDSAAGSGTEDTGKFRRQLQYEISQQLLQREMPSEAGRSTPSPKPTSSNPKEQLEDLYSKGALIGSGAFGNVYAGIRKKDGLPVAIKEILKEDMQEVDIPALGGKMPKEVALMMQLSIPPACPYIVEFIEWFEGPESHSIVMERPEPCQDLHHYSIDCGGSLSEEVAQLVLLQLLLALFHCEDRGLQHGDIQAPNLLIQTESLQVKLIDFGCGSFRKDSSDPKYLALHQPLQSFLLHMDGVYTVLDISTMLFRLMCGTVPIWNQETGSLDFPRAVSEEFQDLMDWCFNPKRNNRPTLEQIASHPWLQKGW